MKYSYFFYPKFNIHYEPLFKFEDNFEDSSTAKTQANFDTKPRMRICFDPEHEIPKLQSWFAENNHPSRLQVEEYVTILNSLESRKGKKPLDINNVIYWFKNTRYIFYIDYNE